MSPTEVTVYPIFRNKPNGEVEHAHGHKVAVLTIVGTVMLAGCGSTTTNATNASHSFLSYKALSKAPTDFANVHWLSLTLPGQNAITPGMLPTAHCHMSLLSSRRPGITYLVGDNLPTLAIVPGWCASYAQSPYNVFVYEPSSSGAPKLMEILYQGLQTSVPITSSVPTASLAATKPFAYSGLFYWHGLTVEGTTLILHGLVIPKGKKLTVPYYLSVRGLSKATYYYKLENGRFVFTRAITPGVAPVVPGS